MKLTKKGLVFIALVAASMVLGSMIAVMCSDSSVLQFLSYAKTIGIDNGSPMVIDLIVIQLTLGFSVNISVAHIITFFAAILLYPKISKNLE